MKDAGPDATDGNTDNGDKFLLGFTVSHKNYMLKLREMCRMVLPCFKKLPLTTSVTFIRSLIDEEDERCMRLNLHTVMRATTI